ncbi:MAG: phosphoribosylformylglycinamidine synthase subunit PurS [Acidimicrobiia bacterium]|nr:phosphoribosylformylglycinamidine synthase subunit PurS [Acidimicrobiia bacterium]
MAFVAHIDVSLKAGILDPQGGEIERALPALGYSNVSDVRVGKTIRLVVDAPDAAGAEAQVVEMCDRLLANPVIESYSVDLEPVATGSSV